MKFKSEKGFTGIEIAVAVIVLFIGISIIAVLSYNYNSSQKEVELKSEATYLAIDEIERIKNVKFEQLVNEQVESEEIKEGFYKNVLIQDYHDIDKSKAQGLVKKVTVQIQYMFKAKKQTVELSTIMAKEY